MLRNTEFRYGIVAKFFHWLIFLLLFGMIIFGYFLDDIPKDYQPIAFNTHKVLGITILFLMLLRLLWALTNPKPVLPFDTLPWQKSAERIVQFCLYLFAICMPLSGWIGSVAAGRAPHLGNFVFQLPIAPDKILSKAAFNMHGLFALLLIGFVAIHVAAALYHQFIKKDNILRRMWF